MERGRGSTREQEERGRGNARGGGGSWRGSGRGAAAEYEIHGLDAVLPIASLPESCGIGASADSASYLDAVSSLLSLPPQYISSIYLLPRHQNAYVTVQLINLDSTVESALGLP